MEEEGSVVAASLAIQEQSGPDEPHRHDGEPRQATALKCCTPRTVCMGEESPSAVGDTSEVVVGKARASILSNTEGVSKSLLTCVRVCGVRQKHQMPAKH